MTELRILENSEFNSLQFPEWNGIEPEFCIPDYWPVQNGTGTRSRPSVAALSESEVLRTPWELETFSHLLGLCHFCLASTGQLSFNGAQFFAMLLQMYKLFDVTLLSIHVEAIQNAKLLTELL